MSTESFGNRLGKLIELLDLNKNKFATRIDVDQSRISGYVVRGQQPGLDFFRSIKNVFPEVDLNWLINGDGQPFVTESDSQSAYDTSITNIQKQEIESLKGLLNIQEQKEAKHLKEIERLKKLLKSTEG